MRITMTLLFVLLSLQAFAQQFELTTTNITVQDGLVGDNVYCAFQDHQGYIWFGTETGVSRYNGVGFTNFQLANGLGDNEVFRIDQDSQKRIWFSAFNGQLSYFLNGRFHNPGNDSTLAKVKAEAHYTNFFEDSYGAIWFTTNNEVIRIGADNSVQKISSAEGEPPYVNTFIEENGEIWGFSARRNVEIQFWTQSGRVKGLETQETKEPLATFERYISGKKTHLTQFDFKTAEDYLHELLPDSSTPLPRISKIHQGTPDQFWACTYQGAILFDKANNRVRKLLPDHIVTHILQDREAGYWITTLGDGVFYAASMNYRSVSKFKERDLKSITSFHADGENVFFGGTDAVFGQFLGDSISLSTTKMEGRLMTKSMALGFRPNTFLLAIESQLIERNHDRVLRQAAIAAKTVKKWKDKYVIGDRKTIVVVTPEQLNKLFNMDFYAVRDARILEGPTDYTDFVQTETAYIIDVEPYQNGLLVGTAEGLFFLDESYNYKKISGHPLMDVRINDIALHGEEYVLSTHGFGILMKVDDAWTQITTEQGLASNIIRKTVIQLNDLVWAATNGGVSRIVLENDQVSINNLNKNNGLNSEQVYDLLVDEDELVLGTGEGISIVEVKDWSVEEIPPLLNISAIVEDGKLRQEENPSIPYGFRNLEIQYDGIHFRSLDRLRYKYRLLGQSEEWSQSEQRSVNFGGLSPGDYTFEVRAISSFGIPSSLASVRFRVITPFWLSWWFISLVAIAFALLIVSMTSYFLKRRRDKERKELEFKLRIAEAERKALQSQLNPHFIFNSLNSIQSMVLKKQPQDAYDYLERFSKLIRRILELSESPTVPLSDELATLELYIELENQRLKNRFEYAIEVGDQVNLQQHVPSLMIQPYVENAIWHGLMPLEGKRSGKLEISVFGTDAELFIVVSDNGVGRQASVREGAMGTQLAKDLVNNLSEDRFGTVEIEDLKQDGEAMGTRVTLHIMNNKAHYDKSIDYRR